MVGIDGGVRGRRRAAIFGLPAAFGATWLVGDNLIQNYPLRVLVGIDLRHGHLPRVGPLPLERLPPAGRRSTPAPPTPPPWLFAVLPGALAWVLNQALVEVVAAAGDGRCCCGSSAGPGGVGAGRRSAFAFGGFMAAQSVHLDLVQAAAWLPWAFAALDRLAHRPRGPVGRPLGGHAGRLASG